MPKKLSGIMKIPNHSFHNAFIAEQYISPSENITLNGDWWLNLRTNSRELSPDHGLCLWSLGFEDGRDSSNVYFYLNRSGSSMKYALSLEKLYFEEAKEGGLFFGSNYKKIIRSCKEDGIDVDDILIITESQEKSFSNRVDYLLPNLENIKTFKDIKIFVIDECFRGKIGGGGYDGIALVYGLEKSHPATLWLNLDKGDCTIGEKKWTVLLRKDSYGSDIKEKLSQGDFKEVVKSESSWWKNYTMEYDLQLYQETIGSKVAQYCDGSFFDCNHHLVISPDQIPDNWVFKDGKWYRRTEERDTSGSTYGLIDLFFSI